MSEYRVNNNMGMTAATAEARRIAAGMGTYEERFQGSRPQNFKDAGVKLTNPGTLARSVDNAMRSGGNVGGIEMQFQLKIARLNQRVYDETISPQDYANQTNQAGYTMQAQRGQRTIDFAKNGPSASELREQGNAEIKAAQNKELKRLGGGGIGGQGPTKISQTLVDDTPSVALRAEVAKGTAAKAQTQSQFGFTEKTKMFGYSSLGSFEDTRQKEISFYNQQVMLNNMGLSVNLNQLNKSGVSTLYNQQLIGKEISFKQPKQNYLYSVSLFEGSQKQNYAYSVNLYEGGPNDPTFIGPPKPNYVTTPYGSLEYIYQQEKFNQPILDNKRYDSLLPALAAGFGNAIRYSDAVDLGELPKPQGMEVLNYYASRGLRPFYNLPLALSGGKYVSTTTESLFGNVIDAGSGDKPIEVGLAETWNKIKKEPLGALVEFPAEAALWITGGKAVSAAVQGITKGTRLITTNPNYLMSILKPRELGSTVFVKKSGTERIRGLFKQTPMEKTRAGKIAVSQKFLKSIGPERQGIKIQRRLLLQQELKYKVTNRINFKKTRLKFNTPSFTMTSASMGTSLTGLVIRTRGSPKTPYDVGPTEYKPSRRSNEIDFKDNAEGINNKDIFTIFPSKAKKKYNNPYDSKVDSSGYKEIKTSSGVLLQKLQTKVIEKTKTIQKTIQKTKLESKLKTAQITKLRLKSKTKLRTRQLYRTAYSTALIQSQRYRTDQKLMSKLATKQIQRKKILFKPAYKVEQKAAIKPMLKQKTAQKPATKLLFKQDLVFPPIIETPLKFVIPPPRKTPPRRPGIIAFLLPKNTTDKTIGTKKRSYNFLGNTRTSEITGFRTRTKDIDVGDKRTRKLYREDILKTKRSYKKSDRKNLLGKSKISII